MWPRELLAVTFLLYLPSDVPPSQCCNKESRRRNLQTVDEQQSGSPAKERDGSFSLNGPTGVDPAWPGPGAPAQEPDPESAVVSGEAPKIAPETYTVCHLKYKVAARFDCL